MNSFMDWKKSCREIIRTLKTRFLQHNTHFISISNKNFQQKGFSPKDKSTVVVKKSGGTGVGSMIEIKRALLGRWLWIFHKKLEALEESYQI